MPVTTPGRLLIDEALPPDMRDKGKELHSKGLRELFQEIATRYPEQYRDITHNLMSVGREAMYTSGGYSFGLRHMLPARAFINYRNKLQQQIQQISANPKLSEEEKSKKIIEVTQKEQSDVTKKVYDESLAEKNPLAMQIHSGSKGKPFNLMSLRGGDLLYVDHHDRHIPIPVLRSYSEGLLPGEYWAGAYGARKGLVDLKMATQDAGYFGKQLTQAAHRLLITANDGEKGYHPDHPTGFPTTIDDQDNEGALLAHKVGPYERNTILTPKVLAHLKQLGHSNILVRSPTIGGPPDGGVYARDVGVRERGAMSPIGDFVGIGAAQSISEPLAQAQIGCLAAGTLVRMANYSTKRIEDILVNDYVLGADNQGRTFPVRVSSCFDNGIQSCCETVFKYGKHRLALLATEDHKVLSITNKSNCKEANLNDQPRQLPVGYKARRYSAVLPSGLLDDRNMKSESYDLLIGLLLGDGCFTKSVNGVYFSCFDDLLIKDSSNYMLALGLEFKELKDHYGYYRVSQLKKKTNTPNPVRVWLRDNGLLYKYSYEKELPDCVQEWSNESIKNLLIGLFTTDGSIYQLKGKTFLNYASTSLKMVQQVADLLLLRFGIMTSGIKINRSNRKRNLFSIEICKPDHLAIFSSKIGFVGKKHLKMLNTINHQLPTKYNRISRYTQIPIGELRTYDIEVEHQDHLFVLANGLIVSNSKHTGGVAGAGAGVSGFKAINQLVQVPKVFPGGASHSQVDGRVQRIESAPGGGYRVFVNDQPHYVGVGFNLKVKPGDVVEAGDMLSDGLPNPAEIVRHKGIGEGRKAFVDAFKSTARDAGFGLHRRNIELVARGLINHVVLHDQMGDYLPDEIVPYSTIEHMYQPRPGHRVTAPGDALGHYLERPVLHYSIGTQIRPSIINELKKYGVRNLTVHNDPPPFEPDMVRGMENLSHDPDWMTRMLGSNLEKGLLKAVHRGGTSNERGTSYVPSLAKGTEFGKWPPVKGYDPIELKTNKSKIQIEKPGSQL